MTILAVCRVSQSQNHKILNAETQRRRVFDMTKGRIGNDGGTPSLQAVGLGTTARAPSLRLCVRNQTRSSPFHFPLYTFHFTLFSSHPLSPRWIQRERMAMSAGFTPDIRDAWPRFSGRTAFNFSRDSNRKAVILS